ncbi:hypothetical protein LZ32DRAFT_198924 [Colletotrichum eremochloae]|nr:hypothetical protein LZ32DRAFT_198924 [Colletotrichum eremochloae]
MHPREGRAYASARRRQGRGTVITNPLLIFLLDYLLLCLPSCLFVPLKEISSCPGS